MHGCTLREPDQYSAYTIFRSLIILYWRIKPYWPGMMTMTLDVAVATDVLSQEPSLNGLARADDSGTTLVERIVRAGCAAGWISGCCDPAAVMPSIRQFADRHGVSRFTVVEAYERLVAQGYLESRRGSGFYVRDRRPLALRQRALMLRRRFWMWCGWCGPCFRICRRNGCRDRDCCRRTGWTAICWGAGCEQ
jgi:hypothetical protein